MRGYELFRPNFIASFPKLFLPMRGYEISNKRQWVRIPILLFLPMRGYEEGISYRKENLCRLFLPMRGYEP